jgi:translation initiation factor 3 subunit G
LCDTRGPRTEIRLGVAKMERWGDSDDDEQKDTQIVNDLPKDEVIGPNEEGIKKTITYRINDDGKKEKRVETVRIENQKMRVHKNVPLRRQMAKFGDSANDPPGPHYDTTAFGEDVYLTLVRDSKALDDEKEVERSTKQAQLYKFVMSKIEGDTWSRRAAEAGEAGDTSMEPAGPAESGKYVPPSRRGLGTSMYAERDRRDDTATIRVSNLSEDTRESDLQELFRPWGIISRIYLAKDKETGKSKGFAFINYNRREDGEKAIQNLSGYGFDHLILNVEWAKPSSNDGPSRGPPRF